MGAGGLRLLSFLDIFGKLCESAVESLFVRVIIGPLVGGFTAVLAIVIFRLVGFPLAVESLIMRRKGILRVRSTIKWSQYFSLVGHFFFSL